MQVLGIRYHVSVSRIVSVVSAVVFLFLASEMAVTSILSGLEDANNHYHHQAG